MTPWLLAPCVVRLAPVSSRQMPYIRSLHGKLTTSTWQGGLRAVPGPRALVYGEAASSRPDHGFRQAHAAGQTPTMSIGRHRIVVWVRAGRADCYEPVYRRNPAARGGTGRAARPAMAAAYASISPEVRPVGHDHRNAVEHVYQACLELLFPAVLGQPGRKAVHRGETPGVDLIRRVD